MRGILFDLDGVVYNSDRLIDGAAETLRWVRQEAKIPHLFVTNTSSRGRQALADKLSGFGIETDAARILNPALAAADWLRGSGRGPVALFVRPSTREEFAGLPLVGEDSPEDAAVSHVVIGDLGIHWDYRTLNHAFRLLYHNPQADLIALGMTRYWMAADGISLDVAPFVAALQHATGREPLVFGKPAARFFHAAAQRLGLAPQDVLMIGDDIEGDVLGAQEAGLRGALVRTGKFRPADLEGRVRLPDVVWDSVASLPGWWKEQR